MKYVFDNNSLIAVFKHYYFDQFPSFWELFNPMVKSKEILSVREVRREMEESNRWNLLKKWAKNYPDFFSAPSEEELKFITTIFEVKHFQTNIEHKKLLAGKPVADPFIIAKAKVNNAIVVTEEAFKEHASKIPNICAHFNIENLNLQQFLIKENWTF